VSNSEGTDLDLCRDMVSGLFDTVLSTEDEHDLLPLYHQLASHERRYGEKTILGTGSLKIVYKCLEIAAKREVAWATPRPELGRGYYDQFIYEAWLTASLKHPNIIKILEVGIDSEGCPFFTMDLKSGKQLNDAIHHQTIHSRLNLFTSVCGAVSYAHSQGVLHLDLKPENIQCDQFGEVLVCDWGLGKSISAETERLPSRARELADSHDQTLYGEIKGTPGYMAPEQVLKSATKDFRTDVYALGGILYYLLTGERPVVISDQDDLINKTLAGAPSLRLNPSVPSALAKITDKALQLAPDERYQSVQSLLEDIQAYQEHRAIQQDSHNLLKILSLFCLRHARVLITACCALILLTTLTLWNQYRERELRDINNQIQKAQSHLSQEYIQLDAEYQYFEHAMVKSQKELFERIIGTAIERFRQFHRISPNTEGISPVALIHEVDLLSTKAYEKGLTNNSIPLLIHSNAVQLNFKRILLNQWNTNNHKYQLFYEYARLFPEYNFNIRERPTVEELTTLLDTIGNQEIVHFEFIQGVMHFDIHSRNLTPEYNRVLIAFLKLLNPSKQSTINYNHEERILKLHNIDQFDSNFSYSGKSALSLIDLKKLELQGSNFKSALLHEANIEILDLSKIDKIIWQWHTKLPQVQKLILSKEIPSSELELVQYHYPDTLILLQ